MRTRIISAFPGTGKSVFHKNNPTTTLDSDSSNFSWTYENGNKERNPDFPQNYVDHIKENIGKYDFIFVSSHEAVREILLNNCLFFYWVCPSADRKQEFINRYKERGSDDAFVKLLDTNWDSWMKEYWMYPDVGLKKVDMILPNLEDEIRHIIASENGEI